MGTEQLHTERHTDCSVKGDGLGCGGAAPGRPGDSQVLPQGPRGPQRRTAFFLGRQGARGPVWALLLPRESSRPHSSRSGHRARENTGPGLPHPQAPTRRTRGGPGVGPPGAHTPTSLGCVTSGVRFPSLCPQSHGGGRAAVTGGWGPGAALRSLGSSLPWGVTSIHPRPPRRAASSVDARATPGWRRGGWGSP